MRVINVIIINHGAVEKIESFGVFEEQLSSDVVEQAEKVFIEKILEHAELPNQIEEFEKHFVSMESYIEDGVFLSGRGSSVCLTWSEIN